MKTPAENLRAALDAIQALNYQMQDGDPEPADAIREIGTRAADILRYALEWQAPATGSHRAVRLACDHATSWPVNLPALEELRERVVGHELPPGIGSAVMDPDKREGKGKTRTPAERGGFRLAYEVFLILEARRRGRRMPIYDGPWADDAASLPPLANDTLRDWQRVGLALVRWDFKEHGRMLISVDPGILQAIMAKSEKEGKSVESCFSTVVKRRLKGGFESLIGARDAKS